MLTVLRTKLFADLAVAVDGHLAAFNEPSRLLGEDPIAPVDRRDPRYLGHSAASRICAIEEQAEAMLLKCSESLISIRVILDDVRAALGGSDDAKSARLRIERLMDGLGCSKKGFDHVLLGRVVVAAAGRGLGQLCRQFTGGSSHLTLPDTRLIDMDSFHNDQERKIHFAELRRLAKKFNFAYDFLWRLQRSLPPFVTVLSLANTLLQAHQANILHERYPLLGQLARQKAAIHAFFLRHKDDPRFKPFLLPLRDPYLPTTVGKTASQWEIPLRDPHLATTVRKTASQWETKQK